MQAGKSRQTGRETHRHTDGDIQAGRQKQTDQQKNRRAGSDNRGGGGGGRGGVREKGPSFNGAKHTRVEWGCGGVPITQHVQQNAPEG